ncbi:MAG: SRPBCC domain-containing protein, partial [Chitinophagaceae bacterium]
MQKRQFKVVIDAPREKVWSTLWNDATYREWTSVFHEGSNAQSDWKKGSKILFVDNEGSGMVSQIEDLVPNEFMSFKHLGEVKGNVEDTTSDKIKEWAGAHENYTLKDRDGKTELTVDMDINDEFWDYFKDTFPKAMNKVKEISERSGV